MNALSFARYLAVRGHQALVDLGKDEHLERMLRIIRQR